MKGIIRKSCRFLFPIAASAILCLFMLCVHTAFDKVLKSDEGGYGGLALFILMFGFAFIVYLSVSSYLYSKFCLRDGGMKLVSKILFSLYNAVILSVFLYPGVYLCAGNVNVLKLLINVFSRSATFWHFCKLYFIPGIIWCMIWSLPNIWDKLDFSVKLLTPFTVGAAFNILGVILIGLILSTSWIYIIMILLILCFSAFSFFYSRKKVAKEKFKILFAVILPFMTVGGVIALRYLILKWFTYIFSNYLIPRHLDVPILVFCMVFSLIGIYPFVFKRKKALKTENCVTSPDEADVEKSESLE